MHTLARQQLPALVKAVFGRSGRRTRAFFQHAHPRNQRQHAVAIRLIGGAGGSDGGFDDGHPYAVFP